MPCNLLSQKVCGGAAINTYNTWMYERRNQKKIRDIKIRNLNSHSPSYPCFLFVFCIIRFSLPYLFELTKALTMAKAGGSDGVDTTSSFDGHLSVMHFNTL